MSNFTSTRTMRLSTSVCAALAVALLAAPAVRADRPTDKDVKDLIERLNHDRDRFEDQLDGKLKRSILRGPGGEVNVERYLDDLQDNVGKLKDRFTPQYAASAEATTVLRQGSDIQRYMVTLPPNFDGASEWTRLAASLGDLAAAYTTVFPLPDGQQARRMNDKEVQKAAEEAAKGADRFKKELDSFLKQNKAVDQATREAAVKEADDLKHDAEKLGSTIGDGKPASGEAKVLLTRVTAIRGATSGRGLSPAAQTAWGSVESAVGKVAQAFGLPSQLP